MSSEIISALIGAVAAITITVLQIYLSKRKETNLKLEIRKILEHNKIKKANIILKKEKRYKSEASIGSSFSVDIVEIELNQKEGDLSEKEKELITKYCKIISKKV